MASLFDACDQTVTGRPRIVRDPDKWMVRIWWVDLEAVNLRQIVKPMIDCECGVSVGLNLSRA
jgi:hypothetical protein